MGPTMAPTKAMQMLDNIMTWRPMYVLGFLTEVCATLEDMTEADFSLGDGGDTSKSTKIGDEIKKAVAWLRGSTPFTSEALGRIVISPEIVNFDSTLTSKLRKDNSTSTPSNSQDCEDGGNNKNQDEVEWSCAWACLAKHGGGYRGPNGPPKDTPLLHFTTSHASPLKKNQN